MKYTCEIPCFDLRQIDQSGQCFRMTPLADLQTHNAECGFRIISNSHILLAWQNHASVTFQCSKDQLDFWLSYFDCGCDYQSFIHSINPKDSYLQKAAKAGAGIRILRQDLWEMIITFVISQQKTIPKIRELVEAICRSYGSPIKAPDGETVYTFPTPDQLAAASLEDLLALKLGYRAKYIHRLSQEAARNILNLELLHTLEYQEAMDYLTGFYGIGKKVANCVCLFGLHHINAFPIDTWIQKILTKYYYNSEKYPHIPAARLYETLVADHFGAYEGYAGVMQQYIFFYERLKAPT